jgi:hypothetical protein
LRNRKALNLLVENARVTEEDWQEETDKPQGGDQEQK